MLTVEQQQYIKTNNLRLLVSAGDDSLYLSPTHGTVTVQRAIELDQLHAAYRKTLAVYRQEARKVIEMTDAMVMHDEMCIDQHGCSAFGD